MTKEEFIDSVIKPNSNKDLLTIFEVIECECGEEGCKGWAVIHKAVLEMYKDNIND